MDLSTRKKGCRIKHITTRKKSYSLFTLQVYPPLILRKGSIYIPPMDNGGTNQSVSWHMEGQAAMNSLLDGGKSKCFFFTITPNVRG